MNVAPSPVHTATLPPVFATGATPTTSSSDDTALVAGTTEYAEGAEFWPLAGAYA